MNPPHVWLRFNNRVAPLNFLSPWCARSFTPPHGLTKEMSRVETPLWLSRLVSVLCRGDEPPLSGGVGVLFVWYPPTTTTPLSLFPTSPALSLLMINQFHRSLWSVVSCYLDTSCHDLPGPLVFPWWRCAHPVISLAAPSWWPVATPGPDPQLPSSLPHGPIRRWVCVHVALQPF